MTYLCIPPDFGTAAASEALAGRLRYGAAHLRGRSLEHRRDIDHETAAMCDENADRIMLYVEHLRAHGEP